MINFTHRTLENVQQQRKEKNVKEKTNVMETAF